MKNEKKIKWNFETLQIDTRMNGLGSGKWRSKKKLNFKFNFFRRSLCSEFAMGWSDIYYLIWSVIFWFLREVIIAYWFRGFWRIGMGVGCGFILKITCDLRQGVSGRFWNRCRVLARELFRYIKLIHTLRLCNTICF